MIAKTILEQIGGRRFAAMTGSKDFIDMGNGLRMSLARNQTSANRLDIIYDGGADLYNMRFYRRTFSKKTFESRTKDIETFVVESARMETRMALLRLKIIPVLLKSHSGEMTG